MDREKVIKALEHCKDNQHVNDCNKCDYGGKTGMFCIRLIDDTLTLLKEQEAKTPVEYEHNGYWDYVCPTCENHEELFREWNYCPFCGQKVKWE